MQSLIVFRNPNYHYLAWRVSHIIEAEEGWVSMGVELCMCGSMRVRIRIRIHITVLFIQERGQLQTGAGLNKG
jgi:hypothetical protein